MFAIIRPNREYYHYQGKIILFDNQEQANAFVNQFINYSVQRLTKEGREVEAMSAPMLIMQQSQLIPINFDIDTVPCGTIHCKDLPKTNN